MSSKYDYTGKTIYVGIDVHKNSYSVVVTSDKVIVKRDRLVASPTDLVCYLKNNFSGAKINTAYEAGFSGFHLHRCLMAHNINNIVVHPASIEIAARERVKTYKRDALKISAQLADGKLRCVHIPDEEQEANRRITRLRSTLIEDRNRYGNRIKALLFQHSLIAANKDPSLTNTFETIAKRAGKKRAIVAIARRLIGRIKACIMRGEKYKIKE